MANPPPQHPARSRHAGGGRQGAVSPHSALATLAAVAGIAVLMVAVVVSRLALTPAAASEAAAAQASGPSTQATGTQVVGAVAGGNHTAAGIPAGAAIGSTGEVMAAAGPAAAAPGRVLAIALGTAQDGGLPQPGCECVRCAAARRDPGRRRHVASLALQMPAGGHTYLIDATPDLGEQLAVVHRYRPHPAGGPDRQPVDGVLLTHAHIGHYLGLAWFGYESLNSREIPVYASARMAAFLTANGPWSLLVARHNIALRTLTPGAPLALDGGIVVTPIVVPHRDELSDTLGFVVRGPRRTLLYVPDTDSWSAWARPLPEVLRREHVDLAVLDGTFYSAAELPDRDVRRIGHPLMTATITLLRDLVRGGTLQVHFTHLNHSNPAGDPDSPERRALAGAGFRVLEEGQELDL